MAHKYELEEGLEPLVKFDRLRVRLFNSGLDLDVLLRDRDAGRTSINLVPTGAGLRDSFYEEASLWALGNYGVPREFEVRTQDGATFCKLDLIDGLPESEIESPYSTAILELEKIGLTLDPVSEDILKVLHENGGCRSRSNDLIHIVERAICRAKGLSAISILNEYLTQTQGFEPGTYEYHEERLDITGKIPVPFLRKQMGKYCVEPAVFDWGLHKKHGLTIFFKEYDSGDAVPVVGCPKEGPGVAWARIRDKERALETLSTLNDYAI
jgi:hypothetical protein